MVRWRDDPYKREIGKAIINLQRAIDNLAVFHARVEPDHPELLEAVTKIGSGMMFLQDNLLELYKECWGYVPKDLEERLGREIKPR